jgi:hypothetical protein
MVDILENRGIATPQSGGKRDLLRIPVDVYWPELGQKSTAFRLQSERGNPADAGRSKIAKESAS